MFIKYFILFALSTGFIINNKADLAYGSERQIISQVNHVARSALYGDPQRLELFLRKLGNNMRSLVDNKKKTLKHHYWHFF